MWICLECKHEFEEWDIRIQHDGIITRIQRACPKCGSIRVLLNKKEVKL